MKRWQWILVVIGVLVTSQVGYVGYRVHDLTVDQVTEDLFVLYGLGGNVGVLATEEGTVVIDTMTLVYQGSQILQTAEQLTGSPVSMVINTHYHLDHTHGNPAFPVGTRVVSTQRTLEHIDQTDAEFFSGKAAALKPNETFDGDSLTIDMGNKTLVLLHPGRGHTDGDLVVLMKEEKVIHAGDLFFYEHYPNIDLEGGGSVQEWGDTMDRVLELDFHTAIPGHGPVTSREQFEQFQAFVRQLAEIGRWAKAENMSLADTLATDRLTEDAGYEPITMIVPIGLDRPFVLQRAWEETHGEFDRRP